LFHPIVFLRSKKMTIKEALARVIERRDLSAAEAEAVMGGIMTGEATPAQIGALLAALRMKGETVAEVAGCARAMRAAATRVPCHAGLVVDTCGTGGDSRHTFNISTFAALVVAGAGLTVAKHGNRSVSSRCGSADVFEALGVRIDLPPDRLGACLDEVGIAFLFAPALHPAMKHAIGPRREMGVRTIFNLLGPLANPAGAHAQVVGVYDPRWVEPLARVLGDLGARGAFVVHGAGGLDEFSTTGPSTAARLEGGAVRMETIDPAALGLPEARIEDLAGGDAAANAALGMEVLRGAKGPRRDAVLLNAAAALVAAGAAPDWPAGLAKAAAAVDSGTAMAKLDALRAFAKKG
jgi:anthranilate phosphoribosyltransferase